MATEWNKFSEKKPPHPGNYLVCKRIRRVNKEPDLRYRGLRFTVDFWMKGLDRWMDEDDKWPKQYKTVWWAFITPPPDTSKCWIAKAHQPK